MPTQQELATGQDKPAQKREKLVARAELAVQVMDRVAQGYTYGGVEVETVKFKLPGDSMSEGLVVVTGTCEDGSPVVAFHKAVSFPEMFMGMVARLTNGSLKWRPDEYRIDAD